MNFLIGIYVIVSIPKLLWEFFLRGKKFPSIKDRLGFVVPRMRGEKKYRVWIHAVSLGEMKAASVLFSSLEREVELLVTTSTYTGFNEAKRLGVEPRFLPLDFSWLMRSWLKSFRPHLIIFVEGDVWPNLLREAKRLGIKTALVSGKCSLRSQRRLSLFPFVARALYDSLDLIAVQHELMRARFRSFVKKASLHVGGNLKFAMNPQIVDLAPYQQRFSLSFEKVITIASTHAPEEKELFSALQPLLREDVVILIAPRHPERFEEVASVLSSMNLPFCRWKDVRAGQRIILVDGMGHLPICYGLSRLAIVAGSFSSCVGGHNVLEPLSYGCFVLFGPHMHNQQVLAETVLAANAAKQVSSSELLQEVRNVFCCEQESIEKVVLKGDCPLQTTLDLLRVFLS